VVRVLTGGTGFIGRHLLAELVKRDGDVHVLVREKSQRRLTELVEKTPGADGKVKALVGDVTKPDLGLAKDVLKQYRGAEVFHLAAVYDMEAPEESNQLANVDGTRHVVAFANGIEAARLHHVSSIAIAGDKWKGDFNEDMFDAGQKLDQPYYRTKFEAEKIVRAASRVPFRIYRPGIVIGSSLTGEADKVDGPYYAFKIIQRLRDALPSWWPLLGLEGGRPNLVPVDYVARAIDAIAAQPDLDGMTFHVVDPHPPSFGDAVNEICRAAHAPQFTLRIDTRAAALLPDDMLKMLRTWRVAQTVKRQLLEDVNIPEPVVAYYIGNRARFGASNTVAALQGSGISCPPLHTYAWKIWDYWERHLDPMAPTPRNFRTVLEGKLALVTGASSGIGRAVAAEMARHGAYVVLVSRSREKLEELARQIKNEGGKAEVRPTDLTDLDAIDRLVRDVLQEHGPVDILVNNAGRSIRRSIKSEFDRFHDFERTMQLNYFGPVRLMLALLPEMTKRRSGHIINISSIGVQSYPPRFGAYVASKSALSALSRCVGPEVADDGVAITNIHMPLVRTPMIAPTDIYQNFPTISPEEAAWMVLEAVLTRPPEVSTRLGKLGETVDVVAPNFLHLVMTAAYHVFPDSKPKDGKDGDGQKQKQPAQEEMSVEAAALAYLMKGIHF
jgi:NAD(P)-dependent dehydrogenase (short-subunit alcohol dehydrogenase family)